MKSFLGVACGPGLWLFFVALTTPVIAQTSVATNLNLPTVLRSTEGPSEGASEQQVANGQKAHIKFAPATAHDSGDPGAVSVSVVDLNRDGKLDLVVANFCQTLNQYGACFGIGGVGVLLGSGDGTFQPPVKYGSGGFEGSALAVADVNGDGRPDIIVTNANGNSQSDGSAAVLLNETSYSSKTALTASPNPAAINETMTLTATISTAPAVPNGDMVTFYSGSTALGTRTMTNGTASLTTSFSKAKSYTIKADYPGDAFRKKSSGTMKLVVNP